jgi:hypothetical protein
MISHYEILDTIVKGGAELICKVEDVHLDRAVLIELLSCVRLASPERAQRRLVDTKSIMFAFRKVLNDTVTGERVVRGNSVISLMKGNAPC